VLPAWRWRGNIVLALVFGALAVVGQHWGIHILANFSKLAAMTFLAFWFLSFFESLSWVVLVASIIPLVDIYSVFAGPTKAITTNHVQTFYALSIYFPAPGDLQQANLGLPDLLFFALFLAAAARFELRPFRTWLGGVLSYGARRRPRRRRPAGAAVSLGRLPGRQRRPDLAAAQTEQSRSFLVTLCYKEGRLFGYAIGSGWGASTRNSSP
jgi:hypothetical protein